MLPRGVWHFHSSRRRYTNLFRTFVCVCIPVDSWPSAACLFVGGHVPQEHRKRRRARLSLAAQSHYIALITMCAFAKGPSLRCLSIAPRCVPSTSTKYVHPPDASPVASLMPCSIPQRPSRQRRPTSREWSLQCRGHAVSAGVPGPPARALEQTANPFGPAPRVAPPDIREYPSLRLGTSLPRNADSHSPCPCEAHANLAGGGWLLQAMVAVRSRRHVRWPP